MDRPRLYRAKGKDEDDKNHWYVGYYFMLSDTTYCFEEDYERARKEGNDPDHHYIVFDQMTDWGLPNKHLQAEIRPETLCMSTEYVKNNQTVFQGDIIQLDKSDATVTLTGIIRFGKYKSAFDKDNTEHYGFYIEWLKVFSINTEHLRKDMGYWMNQEEIKVVGNIIDNPEHFEKRK